MKKHICKYCSAETTQSDNECYAKPKHETLEEIAKNYGWRVKRNTFSDAVKANELADSAKQDFIEGAKWQQERMYYEEEVVDLIADWTKMTSGLNMNFPADKFKEWFKQFKKQ